jgi:hypothetical protein
MRTGSLVSQAGVLVRSVVVRGFQADWSASLLAVRTHSFIPGHRVAGCSIRNVVNEGEVMEIGLVFFVFCFVFVFLCLFERGRESSKFRR